VGLVAVAERNGARLLLLGSSLKAKAKGRGHAKVFTAFLFWLMELQ